MGVGGWGIRDEHGKGVSVDDILAEEGGMERLGQLTLSRRKKDELLEDFSLYRRSDGQLALMDDFEHSLPDEGEAVEEVPQFSKAAQKAIAALSAKYGTSITISLSGTSSSSEPSV